MKLTGIVELYALMRIDAILANGHFAELTREDVCPNNLWPAVIFYSQEAFMCSICANARQIVDA